jgi:FkbM family methyltransferase
MKTIIDAAIRKIFLTLGYEIVPTWRIKNREMAEHLRKLFDLLEISCVLDVGANTGQYRAFLRANVGYDGLILSFEPVPELNRILAEKAKQDRQWRIFPFALGSSDTKLPINVTRSHQFTSFLTPDNSAVTECQPYNVVDHQEVVQVRTLDSVIKEMRKEMTIDNIYLKMDTQGYDLEVTKGADQSLGDIRALQTEVSLLPIYQSMPDYRSSIETLEAKGFDITGMFVVSRDRYQRAVEFDCVMINRAIQERHR